MGEGPGPERNKEQRTDRRSKLSCGRGRTACQVPALCVGEESGESCLLLLPIAKLGVELLKEKLLIVF